MATVTATFPFDTEVPSEIDFGAVYGLAATYLRSRTTNRATAGFIRLANSDKIEWRNAGNTNNLLFGSGSSDAIPSWNAIDLVNLSTAQTLTNKSISGATNTLTNIPDGALSVSYLKADGSRALTADWNVGAFKVTASVFAIGDGSVAAPSLALSSDIDGSGTGLYRKAANSLGFVANGVEVGFYSAAGAWMLGALASTQTHTFNGSDFEFQTAGSQFFRVLSSGVSGQTAQIRLQTAAGGGSTYHTYSANNSLDWSVGVDAADANAFKWDNGATPGSNTRMKLTTAGLLTLSNSFRINAGSISFNGVASANDYISIAGSTLATNIERGITAQFLGSSSAVTQILGFKAAVTTSAAAYTCALRAGFYHGDVAVGAGSTITRDIGFRIETPSQGGTGNASIADNAAFSGNYFLNSTSTNESLLSGDLRIATAGKGVLIKEGSNAKMGVSTLSAGTVVVSTTAVTATSRIQLTAQSLGTVAAAKALAITARSAGTSFTITSADATDTSAVAWLIVEPA